MYYEEDFNNDLAVGKRGEKLVAAAFAAKGYKVEDLSGVYEYQQIDTDMRLTDKKGTTITLEVKNDIKSNYTGNVFIETYNRNNTKRGG